MLTLILKWLSFLNWDSITAYTFATTFWFFYWLWINIYTFLKCNSCRITKTGLSDMHRDMLIYLLLTALLAIQCHVSENNGNDNNIYFASCLCYVKWY